MDKSRLIAEVCKRPVLWDTRRLDRSRKEIAKKWKDIASSMGFSVADCKNTWTSLRSCYRVGKNRTQQRIKRDKAEGKYDPNNDYDNKWEYTKEMNFLEKAYDPTTTCETEFADDSDEEALKLSSNKSTGFKHQENEDEAQSGPSDNEHIQTIDDDIIVVLKKSDNEMEMESCHKDEVESNDDNIVEVKGADNDIEMESCHKDEEETNDDNIVEVKESDSEIEMESYHKDEAENNVLLTNSESSNILIAGAVKEEEENLSIPNRQNANVSSRLAMQNINDSHNNFLISFSSQMKSMSQLQNLRFRIKMSNLILNVLKTSHSAEVSKTPENDMQMKAFFNINDPDCNFLISFLPYMKMLTELENLQLRAKISKLMLNVLSENGS